MSEWWTYAPSDFLLFSAATWYRQLALYNADAWPAQLLAIAIGAILVAIVARGRDPRGRIVLLALASAWAVVGWAFHLERHAQFNWAAPAFAVACLAQVVVLVAAMLSKRGIALRRPRGVPGAVIVAIATIGAVAYPALALLAGRDATAAETFGLFPDPTAIASVALLSLSASRLRAIVLPIPLLACSFASLFLWTLGAPEWPLPIAAALAAFVAGLRLR